MTSAQSIAWKLTGDVRHRRLAERFLYDDFLLPLARGENTLPGKHAYSHVNCLSSAAQAYLSLGRRAYFDAALGEVPGLAQLLAEAIESCEHVRER